MTNRVGKKNGLVTFLNFSHREGKRYFWNCKCDCGNSFITRTDSSATSCGCITKQLNKTRRTGKPALNRFTDKDHVKTVNAKLVYRTYQDGNICFEDFLTLASKNCFYCNTTPATKFHCGLLQDGTPKQQLRRDVFGKAYRQKKSASDFTDSWFVYNGLDRMDQSQPHDMENVVTCCKVCNMMKRNMSLREFLDHVRKIAQFTMDMS